MERRGFNFSSLKCKPKTTCRNIETSRNRSRSSEAFAFFVPISCLIIGGEDSGSNRKTALRHYSSARELINQETTGERAGYGGGGVTGIQAALQNFNRELATLRKRLNKYAKAQAERRKKSKIWSNDCWIGWLY